MAKQIRYSEDFKRHAVSIYLKGELSCNQVSQSIHVHPNTLSAWIKKYRDCQGLPVSLQPKPRIGEKKSPANPESDKIFAALADIEGQLKHLKKLIAAYK